MIKPFNKNIICIFCNVKVEKQSTVITSDNTIGAVVVI